MSHATIIESRRFGRIEVDSAQLIHFEGLPGFPGARRFVLLEHDRASAFAWLVCADDGELGFVVTDPWQFFPDYRPQLEASHLRAVGADGSTSLDVLVIASVREGRVHLNLAAPLVVNPGNRRAAQVILERGGYSCHEPLEPPKPPPPDAGS